ncbi:MAG: hypothetical protein DRN01_04215 [Thermoplasmata archaeon]|nr:MAG: hypothetical protein DRN01_04215 [Thermoplasmata archaeon]
MVSSKVLVILKFFSIYPKNICKISVPLDHIQLIRLFDEFDELLDKIWHEILHQQYTATT